MMQFSILQAKAKAKSNDNLFLKKKGTSIQVKLIFKLNDVHEHVSIRGCLHIRIVMLMLCYGSSFPLSVIRNYRNKFA